MRKWRAGNAIYSGRAKGPMNPNIRILLVDDSQAMLNIVDKLLRQCGFTNVEQALSGESALAALRARRHQLVISDVNMPGMNGVQLLTTVRRDPYLGDTCFVLITAQRDRDIIAAAIQNRADCILAKPFTAQVLKMKLGDIPKLKFMAPVEA